MEGLRRSQWRHKRRIRFVSIPLTPYRAFVAVSRDVAGSGRVVAMATGDKISEMYRKIGSAEFVGTLHGEEPNQTLQWFMTYNWIKT